MKIYTTPSSVQNERLTAHFNHKTPAYVDVGDDGEATPIDSPSQARGKPYRIEAMALEVLNTWRLVGTESEQDVVLHVPGLVHLPEGGDPTHRLSVRTEPGECFEALVLEIDVTPGPWSEDHPELAHSLFSLCRDGIWKDNTLGFCDAFGRSPEGPEYVEIGHNAGFSGGGMRGLRRSQATPIVEGRVCRLRYLYDTTSSTTELRMTSGKKRVTIPGKPPALPTIETGRTLEILLGHGDGDTEVATYGWRYSNLKLSLLRSSGSADTSRGGCGR